MKNYDIEIGQDSIAGSEDWESLVSTGMQVREQSDKLEWVYGDLADKVAVQYGRHSVTKYAVAIGVSKPKLLRYRDVSRAIDPRLREEYGHLSWSHFRTVAGQVNKELWLRNASDNSWSVENLAIQIKKARGEEVKPEPKAELVECPYCHKWTIAGEKDAICSNYKDCGHLIK